MPRLIGTKNETSLHRELKFSYAEWGGRTEAEIDGFVADGINSKGEVIEVQTGSLGPIRKKVIKIASQKKIRIIYPAIITKYIEVYNFKNKFQYRRKSPRRGTAWDIFNSLVYAPDLPLVSNLVIEVVLIDAIEHRVDDGKGSWRRKGKSIKDRRLLAFHDKIILKKPKDYLKFLPFKKKDNFTTALLGEKAGIDKTIAGKTLYVLFKMGLVDRIGKQRNAWVYRLP